MPIEKGYKLLIREAEEKIRTLSLEEAVEVARNSEFLHKFLPDELSRRYYAEALRRCEALKNASDPAEYERVHYFNAI